MPTDTWMKERRQVTAWLRPEVYDRLRLACALNRKSIAKVLEEAVEIMLPEPPQAPSEPQQGPEGNGVAQ